MEHQVPEISILKHRDRLRNTPADTPFVSTRFVEVDLLVGCGQNQ